MRQQLNETPSVQAYVASLPRPKPTGTSDVASWAAAQAVAHAAPAAPPGAVAAAAAASFAAAALPAPAAPVAAAAPQLAAPMAAAAPQQQAPSSPLPPSPTRRPFSTGPPEVLMPVSGTVRQAQME